VVLLILSVALFGQIEEVNDTSVVGNNALDMMELPEFNGVTDIYVSDSPNDAGKSIDLIWELPSQETKIAKYLILKSSAPNASFDTLVEFLVPTTSYTDTDVEDNKKCYYRIDLQDEYGRIAQGKVSEAAVSKAQWFNKNRIAILIFAAVYGILVLLYIELAKKDRNMFIRRIAGLDAIDDAVGRATEMGKPILFSFGIGYLYDVPTIAALSILRRVARRAAEYETRLIIPNYDPIVMTAAQETVKQVYSEAGRPDLYNADDITFLTSDQFGYAAGVDGIMLREKPGTVFLQGIFYAESLILAETGHSVGAIQIAGTTSATQLPFFVAACDYTLIGEEMYAASAYLDRDPQLLGSLKSEDLFKLIIIALIIGVSTIATIGSLINVFRGEESKFFSDAFKMLNNFFTTS